MHTPIDDLKGKKKEDFQQGEIITKLAWLLSDESLGWV